jgi:peptidoglycan/xylan/chitin deacetylase (PgdA/CDA1 family)
MEIKGVLAASADYLRLIDAYMFVRRSLTRAQVVILMYHSIGPRRKGSSDNDVVDTLAFKKQIEYLCANYEILSLDTLVKLMYEKKGLPGKAVVITFDDGHKSDFIYAYPILKRHRIPATIFLTTGHVGSGELLWQQKVAYVFAHTEITQLDTDDLGSYRLKSMRDRRRARLSCVQKLNAMPKDKKNHSIEELLRATRISIPADLGKQLLLSWDEIREICANGIRLGAHTISHPRLASLPIEEARREIIESKKDIEQRTSQKVTSFAYPFGTPKDFDDTTAKLVKEAGFECAVTTIPGWISPKADLYSLGRVGALEDLHKFKARLSGIWPEYYGAHRG